jgi:hypothetical protein
MRCCRRNARPMRDCKHHPCTRISEISLSETSAMLDGGSTTHREREKKLKANTKRRRKGGVGSKLLRRMDGQKASRKEQPNGEGDSLDWIFGCEPADFCSMLLTKLSSSRSSSRPAAECSLNVLCLRHLPPPAHTARCSPLHWLAGRGPGGTSGWQARRSGGALSFTLTHARTPALRPPPVSGAGLMGTAAVAAAVLGVVPCRPPARSGGTAPCRNHCRPPKRKAASLELCLRRRALLSPPRWLAVAPAAFACCDSHFTVHTQGRRKLTEPGIKKG